MCRRRINQQYKIETMFSSFQTKRLSFLFGNTSCKQRMKRRKEGHEPNENAVKRKKCRRVTKEKRVVVELVLADVDASGTSPPKGYSTSLPYDGLMTEEDLSPLSPFPHCRSLVTSVAMVCFVCFDDTPQPDYYSFAW